MESYTSNHSTRKSETNGAQKNESSTSNGNSGVRDGRTSKAFLPFSDGMKNCLGQVRCVCMCVITTRPCIQHVSMCVPTVHRAHRHASGMHGMHAMLAYTYTGAMMILSRQAVCPRM